jgi:hypothetical protein
MMKFAFSAEFRAKLTVQPAFADAHAIKNSAPCGDDGGIGCEAISGRPSLPHSALTDCTVHAVGMLPTLPVNEMVVPFMNHIDVLPLESRQRRSLMPSPL